MAGTPNITRKVSRSLIMWLPESDILISHFVSQFWFADVYVEAMVSSVETLHNLYKGAVWLPNPYVL